MEAVLGAVEGAAVAQFLRTSRWGYAALNTTHVVGIALLVGAMVPLNLRLFGVWPSISRAALVRVLAPVALTGLALAIATGPLLFAVRAREYADIGFLQAKLVLITLAVVSAIAFHMRHGSTLEGASRAQCVRHASLSAVCWLGAVVCGRLIAFAGT